MLIGRNVTKSFGRTKVLDALTITITPGTITALLGATGVGKTTLLRALAMIDPPQAGTVQIDDESFDFPVLPHVPIRPWPTVGVVFQDLFLWPHLTNRDNIMLPLKLNKVRDAAERFDEITHELALATFLDRYPNEVSRGQRQAVAIARSLALKPRYVLMDEVTASLDITRAARLAQTLRLRAEQGAGIMIITHQLPFARTQCDRIAYMHDGSVIEEGPPSDLDSPRTRELQAFVQLISSVA